MTNAELDLTDITDLISENNRLIMKEYGGNPPKASEDQLVITQEYIKKIKEARNKGIKLSQDDLVKNK